MPLLIKNDKYDNIVNNIIYISFFIHQLFFLFSVSALARSEEIVGICAYAIIVFSFLVMCLAAFYYFLRGKFSKNEIIIYIILFIPLIISLYNYRVVMVISNLFYAAIFKNVDVKKSLRIALYATIIGFLINILLSIFTKYIGLAVQTYPNGTPRYRYGLGFYYAYITSYYYLTVVIMFILAFDSFSITTYIVLMILNIIVFKLTDTKASFLYTTIALFLHFLFIKLKNLTILYKMFEIFSMIMIPISAILAVFLPKLYVSGNVFWDFLNRVVNGRLRLTHNAFEILGWKWFGQNVIIKPNPEYYIDSAIASMLVQNGLVVFIMSIVFLTFFMYMAIKINHKPLVIVIFLIAIRSIFDLGFMTMQLAPIIIMFYDILYKYKSGVICDY